MTNDEKAAAVLVRCGPYSERGAERFVETLEPDEVTELVTLFEQHAADPTRQQGGRFDDLINNVANRQAKPDKTDRKAAEAAAGQAQSDGTPPLKGTGEP